MQPRSDSTPIRRSVVDGSVFSASSMPGALASMQTQIHETFAALGEPNRLAMVLLLRDEPRRPADIATALSMSRPAISRHLRVLRKSGLAEEKTLEADARGRIYELRREAFSDLREWIEDVEAFWVDQLLTFKAHAERKDKNKSSRRPVK